MQDEERGRLDLVVRRRRRQVVRHERPLVIVVLVGNAAPDRRPGPVLHDLGRGDRHAPRGAPIVVAGAAGGGRRHVEVVRIGLVPDRREHHAPRLVVGKGAGEHLRSPEIAGIPGEDVPGAPVVDLAERRDRLGRRRLDGTDALLDEKVLLRYLPGDHLDDVGGAGGIAVPGLRRRLDRREGVVDRDDDVPGGLDVAPVPEQPVAPAELGDVADGGRRRLSPAARRRDDELDVVRRYVPGLVARHGPAPDEPGQEQEAEGDRRDHRMHACSLHLDHPLTAT